MFELKKMSREGIRRALGKVERYRLLNEPWEAESICQDVLQAEPDNQEALISLLLAMTDQFGHEGGGVGVGCGHYSFCSPGVATTRATPAREPTPRRTSLRSAYR